MPYIPTHDEETDIGVLRAFMQRHRLASVITFDGNRPELDLVPIILEERAGTLYLQGHVARANPFWLPGARAPQVLVTFGPAEHYISPSWYPSKSEHHRAVPTWCYLVVHAWGDLMIHDDPRWVRSQAARLTTAMESHREAPWRMGMAPPDYLAEKLADIVGFEVRVTELRGRFKTAAQRSGEDRAGAHDGVATEQHGRAWRDVADAMTYPPQRRPALE